MEPIVNTGFDTTTSSDLLIAGRLRKIFDTTVHDVPEFHQDVCKVKTTKDMYTIDLRLAGLEDAAELAEGQAIPLYTPTLGTEKKYTQRQFGIGFRMTDKMKKFNKYGLWERWTKELARRQKEARDAEIHVMFNNMTSTSLTAGVGFDTLAIANDTHTGLATGTGDNYDNYLNAGLSLAALESARYYFKTNIDDMGNLRIVTSPLTLIVEPTLYPDALEFTGSELKPGTDYNDINVIKKFGIKPKENPRLTSTTCWFVIAKEDEGYDFQVIIAQEPDLKINECYDRTRDMEATSMQYFTYGWGDPRMLYCGKL
jgi:hypothetical protein